MSEFRCYKYDVQYITAFLSTMHIFFFNADCSFFFSFFVFFNLIILIKCSSVYKQVVEVLLGRKALL